MTNAAAAVTVAVTIGVDVGQKHDPTAIAVMESQRRAVEGGGPSAPDRRWEEHHLARHLERLPLGTPYPQVAERLAAIVNNAHARDRARAEAAAAAGAAAAPCPVEVFVDATGVGQPVVDLLNGPGMSETSGMSGVSGLRVTPVYFTHGDRRQEEREAAAGGGGATRVTLGKAWLVSLLQVLLQTGRVHLPGTAEAKALARELEEYEIRVSENANDTYGAFKVGSHDDLVTALGLAVQGREGRVASPPAGSVAFNPLEFVRGWKRRGGTGGRR
jgi:hypothetical protein